MFSCGIFSFSLPLTVLLLPTTGQLDTNQLKIPKTNKHGTLLRVFKNAATIHKLYMVSVMCLAARQGYVSAIAYIYFFQSSII